MKTQTALILAIALSLTANPATANQPRFLSVLRSVVRGNPGAMRILNTNPSIAIGVAHDVCHSPLSYQQYRAAQENTMRHQQLHQNTRVLLRSAMSVGVQELCPWKRQ